MALPYALPARTGSARAPRLTSPNARDPVLFIGCGQIFLDTTFFNNLRRPQREDSSAWLAGCPGCVYRELCPC
jgi:hypothetical protein